jgi:hypothetical protein
MGMCCVTAQRRSYRAVFVCLLISLCYPLWATTPAQATAPEQITIQTVVRFHGQALQSNDRVWLAGLASREDAPPDLLALSVTGGAGWFGLSMLRLESKAGLLPSSPLGKADTAGTAYIDLVWWPEADHTYEVVFSYAAQQGEVSISVADITEPNVVYAGFFAVETWPGSMHAVRQIAPDRPGDLPATRQFMAIAAEYRRIGTSGVLRQRPVRLSLRSQSRLQRVHYAWEEELEFVLNEPAGKLPGEFRCVLDAPGTERRELFTVPAAQLPATVHIGRRALLPGKYTATLYYGDGDYQEEVDQLDFEVVGPVVAASMELPAYDITMVTGPEVRTVTGHIKLHSSMAVPGVQVKLLGWLDDAPTTILQQVIAELPAGDTVLPFSFQVRGPAQPMRLHLVVESEESPLAPVDVAQEWPFVVKMSKPDVRLDDTVELSVLFPALVHPEYDSGGIQVEAVFTSPSGQAWRKTALYYREFDAGWTGAAGTPLPRLASRWSVRIAPAELGKWTYQLYLKPMASDQAILALASGVFAVTPGAAALEQPQPAEYITLFVSPQGDDSWSGRLPAANSRQTDGPFRTIQRAQQAVRELKRDARLDTPVIVYLRGGMYSIAEPLRFTPADSGTATAPIIYAAYPGETPVISGGKEISGWQPGPGGLWIADIPAVRAGTQPFDQLFVYGRRAVRARAPNDGYFYIAGAADTGASRQATRQLSYRAFRAHRDDLALLSQVPQEQLSDVNVVVYHSWETSRHRIAELDDAGHIYLTGPAKWPFLQWGADQRYYLENLRSALDAPGEWYLDRDGTLFYCPLPSETGPPQAVAPLTEQLLVVSGNPEQEGWVEHITFRGLSLQHAAYILPPEGHSDWQSAVGAPAAILVDGARHLSFEDCEIAHTGGYGLWFRRAVTDSRLVRSRLYDLGAGGVRIGETDIAAATRARTGRITVEHNSIAHGGRIFAGAASIWIGHSGDNTIAHNHVADFYHNGISVGWRFGYGESLAQRNVIEANHIERIGQGVLSDLGGIYTIGYAPGTILRGNTIHDVYSYSSCGGGAWGIYGDEGSSYIVVEYNLVYDTQSGSYHLYYGRENVLRHNTFAAGREGQLQLSQVDPELALRMYDNVIHWQKGDLFVGPWLEANVIADGNTYCHPDPAAAREALSGWQKLGRDLNARINEAGCELQPAATSP